jgi:hypothetical protein
MIQYSSINDAWGNKDINKKSINNIEKFIDKPLMKNKEPNIDKPVINIEKMVPQNHINLNKEKFVDEPSNCSYTEHLKTCENCRKKITEFFNSETSNTKEINIFGLIKFNLTTDVLKVIFVILLIFIFVLLLSMINISFKTNTAMKYYMIPGNLSNIPGQYFG